MGLFSRSNENNINEKMYTRDGYIFGENGIIYHVPKDVYGLYVFPEGTTGLSETAIMELRNAKVKHIIVPGSLKKFNVQLLYFENLTQIDLEEGVEEVNCLFGSRKNAVDIKLPSTIKKIGANNYPVVKDLVLPYGTTEIGTMFASHDTNLVSVNVPGTVKVIPKGAFNQCRNLQSVILNEGIETSLSDAFRGTNNLHTLVLPSTYNGTINLPMEGRPISNVRGNSQYDGKRFAEEQQEILNIKIKRGNKNFEFNIRRGEQPVIEIKQNVIRFRCVGQTQIISIDCEQLEQGIYDIQNGTVKLQQLQTISEQSKIESTQVSQDVNQNNAQEQEIIDKLDILFQNAYRENITKREDFVGLSSTTKTQIKKAMRVLFFQTAKIYGTTNTDYETFDYLYKRAIKETEFEETIQDSQVSNDFDSTGMKR